ncbi:GGDEF domain-containing protein, partial [Bordetella pertussis]
MYRTDRLYSPPAWPVTRWLADPGRNVPDDIRQALLGGLFGTISIFVGGVLNSVLVALIIAIRLPQAPFIAWLAFELACCLARAVVLVSARRADTSTT